MQKTQVIFTLVRNERTTPYLLKKFRPFDPNPTIGRCQFDPTLETLELVIDSGQLNEVITLYWASKKINSFQYKNIEERL